MFTRAVIAIAADAYQPGAAVQVGAWPVSLDHQTRSLSFYDALIVQAASVAGCDELANEDLNAGEVINGVKIINPFL